MILAADRDMPGARVVACSSGAGVVVPPGDPAARPGRWPGWQLRAPLRTVMGERAAAYARSALDRTTAMAVIDQIVERALAVHGRSRSEATREVT